MKLILKTLGWAAISGVIFVLGAVYKGCPWEAALWGAAVATLFKTPAYPVWEWGFNRLWYGKKGQPAPACQKCEPAKLAA